MNNLMKSIFLLLNILVFYKADWTAPYGGKLLNDALTDELSQIQFNISFSAKESPMISVIRQRCTDYLACEYFNPMIELENVIFMNGQIYANNVDTESVKVINSLSRGYAGKEKHLPAFMATFNLQSDWVVGPQINYNVAGSSGGKGPKTCKHVWNTSVYFHFPWEAKNAYHSLNDNLLSLLASITIQQIFNPHTLPEYRTLLLLKPDPAVPGPFNHLFSLLKYIFDNDVRQASALLRGGPHCVRRVTWGNAIKPMYRDSLVHLRRFLFKILKKILHKSSIWPTYRNPVFNMNGDRDWKRDPIRVVIVTRNTSLEDTIPYRKLSYATEKSIADTFRSYGAIVEICCDFKIVNTPSKLLEHFANVDICLGMHGAGLANCVLGREGLVLVEAQHQHAFGFDSFTKIAHMAGGTYVFYDSRNVVKARGPGAGSVLSHDTIDNMARTAIRLVRTKQVVEAKVDGFWIYPKLPELKNVTDILGPHVADTDAYCRLLPYFRLRVDTQPIKEHKNECDKNIIRRKPTGLLKEKLLTKFVQLG